MAEIAWTGEALSQLELIRSYIQQFDEIAADKLVDRLVRAGESLQDFPNCGRPAGNGSRELPSVGPYVIQYEVITEIVFILAIKHGSQRR